jgi:hypothetical protein
MGVIYDKSAKQRISKLLEDQEQNFQLVDKQESGKKIITYSVLVGITILAILGLKLITKGNAKK